MASRVSQVALEVLAPPEQHRVSQVAVEAVGVPFVDAVVSQLAVELLVFWQNTSIVPVSAAFQAVGSRAVAGSAALKALGTTRTVPATASFRATYTRTVAATVSTSWPPISYLGVKNDSLGAGGFTLGAGAVIRTGSRLLPASAKFILTSSRTVAATAQLSYGQHVSQAALETLFVGSPNIRVSQAALETLIAGNPNERVSQTALEVLFHFQQIRTVPITAAFEQSNTRSIPATAAFKATLSRTVPATQALSLTDSRSVPVTAALTVLGTTRTVPATAVLAADRPVPITAVFAANRPVPITARFLLTVDRSVPATGRFDFERVVPVSAAFRRTSSRTVPISAWLWGRDITRFVPSVAELGLNRRVPVDGFFQGSPARSVPSSAYFRQAGWVPATAEFSKILDCWDLPISSVGLRALSLASHLVGGNVHPGGYGGYPECSNASAPSSWQDLGYDDNFWPYAIYTQTFFTETLYYYDWSGHAYSPVYGPIPEDVAYYSLFGSAPVQPVFELCLFRFKFWVPDDPLVFAGANATLQFSLEASNAGIGNTIWVNGNAIGGTAPGGYGGAHGSFDILNAALSPGENVLAFEVNDVWCFGNFPTTGVWFNLHVCAPPSVTPRHRRTYGQAHG